MGDGSDEGSRPAAYPERCPTRILTPIPTRIAPPAISIRLPAASPMRSPRCSPAAVSAQATKPITTAGYQIPTRSTPRLNPTARASMLVATDRTISEAPRVGSRPASPAFSPATASWIIFPPMNRSRPKASQWSYPERNRSTERPAIQPTTGIRNWKNPKCQARRRVWRAETVPRAIPVATATAKASIASPRAITVSVRASIGRLPVCRSHGVAGVPPATPWPPPSSPPGISFPEGMGNGVRGTLFLSPARGGGHEKEAGRQLRREDPGDHREKELRDLSLGRSREKGGGKCLPPALVAQGSPGEPAAPRGRNVGSLRGHRGPGPLGTGLSPGSRDRVSPRARAAPGFHRRAGPGRPGRHVRRRPPDGGRPQKDQPADARRSDHRPLRPGGPVRVDPILLREP